MTGDDLKAWRTRAGLTQQAAAGRFEVNRVTWAKWEAGTNPVPEDVAEIIEAGAVPAEELLAAAAPDVSPLTHPDVPAEIDPVALGLEPWGERPANLMPRDFTRNPLGAGWQVCSWRVVSALIPDPIPYHAPAWAGPDAIVTRSGRIYHYKDGHEIKPLSFGRADKPAAGSLANPGKRYKAR